MPIMWENTTFDDRIPIYLQIMEAIKGHILSAELTGEMRIPSIRELSQKLRVNPNTVQRAYQELEREGYIYSKRGMGYFVAEDKAREAGAQRDAARAVVLECVHKLLDMGLAPEEIMEIVRQCIREGKE